MTQKPFPGISTSLEEVSDVFWHANKNHFPKLDLLSTARLFNVAGSHLDQLLLQYGDDPELQVLKGILELNDMQEGQVWICQYWETAGYSREGAYNIVKAIVASSRHMATLKTTIPPSPDRLTPLSTRRDGGLRSQVALREDFCCVMGSGYDREAIAHEFDQRDLRRAKRKELSAKVGRRVACTAAHLIPISTGASTRGLNVLRFLQAVTGVDVEKFEGLGGEVAENAIFISETHHRDQGNLSLGFRPTSQPNTYDVVWSDDFSDDETDVGDAPETITFVSRGSIPVPNPNIMKIMWQLFQIVHSSAAAEELLLKHFRFDPNYIATNELPETMTEEGAFVLDSVNSRLEGLTTRIGGSARFGA